MINVINGVKFVYPFMRDMMPERGWCDGQATPFAREGYGIFMAHPNYPPIQFSFRTLKWEPIPPYPAA